MSTPLDYEPHGTSARRPGTFWAVSGAVAGAAFTLPAGILAFLSSGAGHGHYEFARIFFPSAMLATHLTGDTITTSVATAIILQFPMYGAMIGFSLARRKLFWIIALIGVHLLAVIACFFGAVPNFS